MALVWPRRFFLTTRLSHCHAYIYLQLFNACCKSACCAVVKRRSIPLESPWVTHLSLYMSRVVLLGLHKAQMRVKASPSHYNHQDVSLATADSWGKDDPAYNWAMHHEKKKGCEIPLGTQEEEKYFMPNVSTMVMRLGKNKSLEKMNCSQQCNN